jgi:hypothetical protein
MTLSLYRVAIMMPPPARRTDGDEVHAKGSESKEEYGYPSLSVAMNGR